MAGEVAAAGITAAATFAAQLAALKAQREQQKIANEVDRRKRMADSATEGGDKQSQSLSQIVALLSR